MSGTEGQQLGGADPIDLQLPRGATGSGREQPTPQPTASVTRLIDTKRLLQVTTDHGDKASFLVGNGPSCLQCEQSANHFMKDSRKQHDSGFPKIPIVRWSSGTFRSGVHTF